MNVLGVKFKSKIFDDFEQTITAESGTWGSLSGSQEKEIIIKNLVEGCLIDLFLVLVCHN